MAVLDSLSTLPPPAPPPLVFPPPFNSLTISFNIFSCFSNIFDTSPLPLDTSSKSTIPLPGKIKTLLPAMVLLIGRIISLGFIPWSVSPPCFLNVPLSAMFF